jgi:hypothetical protein
MSEAVSPVAIVRRGAVGRPSPRLLLMATVVAGMAVGFLVTGEAASARAVADAGAELTRLLRAMAAIKAVLAAGVVWLADWRLRYPIRPWLAAGYLAGVGVMATGPGLIWGMAHVALGALLLHGAGAFLLLLFWRDPGSPAMAWDALRQRRR